ncbi:OsmC family protein [Pseudonocardia sp. GCM10023141]|uniref:OsmC family protein n=1 Tax=Pseudonocardia sp. GCM10023141 TaxID=3252653 RepID=UPI00360CDD2C
MSVETTAPATERDQNLRTIIDATGAALEDNPDKGHALFKATGTGGDGVRSHIRIGGHTVLVDEPPALGGANEAPNPVEAALAGLLSCQVVTYRFWAAQLGIPLEDISVDVEGDLDVRGFFGFDSAVRPGFGEVRVKVTLSGPAPATDYERLSAAVDEHCPVLDLFRNTTPVTTTLVTA